MSEFLHKVTLPKPSPPVQLARQKRRFTLIIVAGIAIIPGVILTFWGGPDLEDWGTLLQVIGIIALMPGLLLNPYYTWVHNETFIGISDQKQLLMWSTFNGFPSSYSIPIANVKTVLRVPGSGGKSGWFFQGSAGEPLVRFNPTGLPAKKHKIILGEITAFGNNIKITHQAPRSKPPKGPKPFDATELIDS